MQLQTKMEHKLWSIFLTVRFPGIHRHCDEVGHTDQCVENWDENLSWLQEEKRPENIFASLWTLEVEERQKISEQIGGKPGHGGGRESGFKADYFHVRGRRGSRGRASCEEVNIWSFQLKDDYIQFQDEQSGLSYSQMNIRAAPSEEEKEFGNAEGGDGVESLGVGEESGVASEEAHIAGAKWTFVHIYKRYLGVRSVSWVQ